MWFRTSGRVFCHFAHPPGVQQASSCVLLHHKASMFSGGRAVRLYTEEIPPFGEKRKARAEKLQSIRRTLKASIASARQQALATCRIRRGRRCATRGPTEVMCAATAMPLSHSDCSPPSVATRPRVAARSPMSGTSSPATKAPYKTRFYRPMPNAAAKATRDLTDGRSYSALRGLLKIYLKACIGTTSATSSVLRAWVVRSITSTGR